MRDVVDAGKRALATHRGVALDVLPHRAEHLRGGRAQLLSAAPCGGVSETLRALGSRAFGLCIAADWELLHGDEALRQDARHLDNVHLLMSRSAVPGSEPDWKSRSHCGCAHDVAQRATFHGPLQEV